MKSIKIFQVDSFTDELFTGNPAAVCILNEAIEEETMQLIANENNLSETAFVIPHGIGFKIRWFTPTVEVDLCGHATLASAFVLFNYMAYEKPEITFYSLRSGELRVSREKDLLFLDFPVDTIEAKDARRMIEACLNFRPKEVFKGKTDFMAVMESEHIIKNLKPDFRQIAKLNARGLIVTAKGNEVDFVSRFFAPQVGIDEDPVTGSAHTTLTPYWSEKLGKDEMTAIQLSKRGGKLICRYNEKRCLIGGNAKLYLSGELHID
jgi:PhzF family phenazine biosynthesis protein